MELVFRQSVQPECSSSIEEYNDGSHICEVSSDKLYRIFDIYSSDSNPHSINQGSSSDPYNDYFPIQKISSNYNYEDYESPLENCNTDKFDNIFENTYKISHDDKCFSDQAIPSSTVLHHIKFLMRAIEENSLLFTDVTLMGFDKIPVKAHRFILSSHSSFLTHLLLQSETNCNEDSKILLLFPSFTSKSLLILLGFLYSGQVEIQSVSSEIEALRDLCCLLGLSSLLLRLNDVPISSSKSESYSSFLSNSLISKSASSKKNMDSVSSFLSENSQEKSSESEKIISSRKTFSEETKVHICFTCNKVFSNKSSLHRHFKSHKEDSSTFTCELCFKVFKESSSYRRHFKEKHTAETFTKFHCGLCSKSYPRRNTLATHVLRVHKVPLEKPSKSNKSEGKLYCKSHKCFESQMSFSNGSLLEIHKGIHTGFKPYVCQTCGKKFARGNNLKLHLRTHSGEKPYECKEKNCSQAFSDVSAFKRHIRTHSGEKPYFCSHCRKRFSQIGSKNSHERICRVKWRAENEFPFVENSMSTPEFLASSHLEVSRANDWS